MILDTKSVGVCDAIENARAHITGRNLRYYVYTFGCQQNEADSEKIRQMAENMGYLSADCSESADLVILNTCAIREHAQMKAMSLLGTFKSQKKKNPNLVVGLVGCMAAKDEIVKNIKAKFPFVSFTAEPNMLHRIPEAVLSAVTEAERTFIIGEDSGNIVEGITQKRTSAHKAMVSIMYGCNNFCTYCVVPYVRGRERSRDSSAIISECKELVRGGVKEIMLLGQNVNSYSSDIKFPELLSRIAELEGDFIIRFMTSHPKDTTSALIDVMKKYSGKVAPYFHLPLQAGSNRILSRMNRTYTRERFWEIVQELREKIPGISLSTDIIVGFPGESEEDFLETLDMLKICRFDLVYAFMYSSRVGTAAAKMDGHIADTVKSDRLSRLFEIQDPISYEKNLPYLDSYVRVLVDSAEERDGERIYTGRTDTNKLVHFTGDAVSIGEFISVKIKKICGFDLIGDAVK
ncbi:MAG: tRNA (N6-isopentenyl adenosine(37)-C2)-methylthiotransferase MiaB [Clostridia bacterium]|nr:tRNA (N6-isopentenyl adenosine(37)-C2)-methylthiotransferase MiaB [Clostridia bacterium]